MIPVIALCVLLSAIAAPSGEKAQAGKTVDLLPGPEAISGWEAGDRKTCSTARALYDYMNGGAEIYIDYGFRDLAVGDWTSPVGDPLRVEIYRMGQPKSAYGMFTQDTWGEEVDVGQGARLQGGTLRFWKGEYLVRVFMWRGYQDHLDVILGAGKSVSGRIKTTGEIPEIVAYLPEEGLAEGGLHFFHTALTLGAFYYFSDGNPLKLSKDTDGVIGEYLLEDGSPAFLVLISYPDVASAEKAYDAFLDAESSVAKTTLVERRRAGLAYDDGLLRTMARRGSFLGLGLDFPSDDLFPELFDQMLDGLGSKDRESAKNKPNKPTEHGE
ncbi:MAG: hypothetical protein KAW17_06135 [Candidatus Eisenbacteria sp.]|nr:hypothetical protein [Candidatus Eisenbacteria bacterium]